MGGYLKLSDWAGRIFLGGIFLFPIWGIGLAAYWYWKDDARFDRAHPDYLYLAGLLKAGLESGHPYYLPATVSLKRINGGDWQFICLIGGYSDPEKIIAQEAAARGVEIRVIDKVEPHDAFDVIGEHEGAISFVDAAGRGRTVLTKPGVILAEESQGFFECFGPEVDQITLPVQNANEG